MWSFAALAAGNIADAQSSWGGREANGFLAGPQGRFDWHSAGLKVAVQAPMIGLELWRIHKHPFARLYKCYTISNFAAGGLFGAVAIHNYAIRSSGSGQQ